MVKSSSCKHPTVLASVVLLAGLAIMPEARASLVAFYDFENNTQDVSGNAQHGAALGVEQYSSDTPSAISARSNTAYSFSVSDAYVRLPAAVSIADMARSGGATLALWFRTSQANSGYLFSEGSSDSSTPLYGLQVGNADDPNLRFHHRTLTTSITSAGTGADFVGGAWHHVSLVTVGTNVKLYLDGVLDPTFADFNHPDVGFGGNQVSLGALVRSGVSFEAVGEMDEVAIFSRALTQQEIIDLTSGVSPIVIPEPASVAFVAAGLTLASRHRRRAATD